MNAMAFSSPAEKEKAMKEMFDRAYVLTFAQKLLAIDSPSGYTHHAIAFLKKEAQTLGYKTALNEKGNLLIYVSGQYIIRQNEQYDAGRQQEIADDHDSIIPYQFFYITHHASPLFHLTISLEIGLRQINLYEKKC